MPVAIAAILLLALLVFSGGLNLGGTATGSDQLVTVGDSEAHEEVVEELEERTNRSAEEESIDTRIPRVDTLAAQNITDDRALLRLHYQFYSHEGPVFIIYGQSLLEIVDLVRTNPTFTEVEERATAANLEVIRASSRARGERTFTRTVSRLDDDETYYYIGCLSYEKPFDGPQIICGDVRSFTTVETDYRDERFRVPSVSTGYADQITTASALITGRYDMRSVEQGTVFFIFGENRTLINDVDDMYEDYRDVDEVGEALQKTRVRANVDDRAEVTRTIDDLERDTAYYYRLCVSYDEDVAAGIRCGSTRSFTTDARDYDEPNINVVNVSPTITGARFSASVNMRDYFDGHAFIVYGTDSEYVYSAPERDRYTRIRQREDQIQTISLDTDVDGAQTFTTTVSDLEKDTTYFVRLCVEYETKGERDRDELTLTCGVVTSFYNY